MPTVTEAHDRAAWNSFLASQQFRPFLQSWEMGEIYRDLGQDPVRLEVQEGNDLVGICFGHVVPARRGRHLSIPYGPVLSNKRPAGSEQQILQTLIVELERIAKKAGCSFIRMGPFTPKASRFPLGASRSALPAPLHLLAEHLWYLPLVEPDLWEWPPPLTPPPCGGEGSSPSPAQRGRGPGGGGDPRSTENIFKSMRATTRNLIRRAEKEGVTITASDDPLRDLPIFLTLHEETRRRHRFTPYTDAFFRAQVKHFSPPNTFHLTPNTSPRCSLYLARYRDEIIASSIHVHFAGETSYHHGASTEKYRNIPASYLLQWTAIQDAIARGDHIYNFWGIAPLQATSDQRLAANNNIATARCPLPAARSFSHSLFSVRCHPFSGVTLFKTGFGGKALELTHCMDLPLKPSYYFTRAFETFRRWRRGF